MKEITMTKKKTEKKEKIFIAIFLILVAIGLFYATWAPSKQWAPGYKQLNNKILVCSKSTYNIKNI